MINYGLYKMKEYEMLTLGRDIAGWDWEFKGQKEVTI